MSKARSALLLIALVSLAVVAQDNQTAQSYALHVLTEGVYHGDEVPYSSGPGWFALIQDGTSSRLVSVELKVDTAQDVIIDANEGPYTGKSISTQPSLPDVVLLLKGTVLRAGVVSVAAIVGEDDGLSPKKISLNDISYSLRLNADCDRIYNEKRQWNLSSGKVVQTIGELPVGRGDDGRFFTDGTTVLRWAGDLDRDGKLDLVVEMSDYYNRGNTFVFLSSLAQKGRLVEEAGVFSITGC
jgi:hypothetical protein